ncbi:hypothetical protein ES708_04396 [subsurface metagenome]
MFFENLRIYDSISVPHHLQNLSLVDSLLPHKEHDLELAGVTFEGVPILLPSILPPQFGQKWASFRTTEPQRIHLEVDDLAAFTGFFAGIALDDGFDFNFFCPLRAITAATTTIPATTIIVIKIG